MRVLRGILKGYCRLRANLSKLEIVYNVRVRVRLGAQGLRALPHRMYKEMKCIASTFSRLTS